MDLLACSASPCIFSTLGDACWRCLLRGTLGMLPELNFVAFGGFQTRPNSTKILCSLVYVIEPWFLCVLEALGANLGGALESFHGSAWQKDLVFFAIWRVTGVDSAVWGCLGCPWLPFGDLLVNFSSSPRPLRSASENTFGSFWMGLGVPLDF